MLDLLGRFAIGAIVVGGALWISDNHTARLGGVISAVPKTSAVSLFVIAYEHGGAFAAETAISSLYGIGAVIVYATTFALLVHHRGTDGRAPWSALALSLAAYAAIVLPYLLLLEGRLALAVNLGVLATAYLASWIVVGTATGRRARAEEGEVEAVPAKHGWARYLLPALVGGSLVLGATLAADLLGPVWGGIASVFPANVTTVMVSGALILDPNDAFDQAASIPDGVAAAGAFVLALHLLLPVLPIALAGGIGYVLWGGVAWGLSSVRTPQPRSEPG